MFGGPYVNCWTLGHGAGRTSGFAFDPSGPMPSPSIRPAPCPRVQQSTYDPPNMKYYHIMSILFSRPDPYTKSMIYFDKKGLNV